MFCIFVVVVVVCLIEILQRKHFSHFQRRILRVIVANCITKLVARVCWLQSSYFSHCANLTIFGSVSIISLPPLTYTR